MKNIAIAFIILLLMSATVAIADDWEVLKGTHFIIYFAEDHEDFADQVLRKAEKDYNRIAVDLGYSRTSGFWTWDKRVKIYIYPDHESFIKDSGQPEWSEGMADFSRKRILTYSGSEDFLISVLPHEMAHLIFRDFVGFKSDIPLWLDEGVAQWEEELKRQKIEALAQTLFRQGKLLSLEEMVRLDVRTIKDEDKLQIRLTSPSNEPGVIIINGKNLISLYYLQAASLVGFLINRFGAEKFTNFCRELRDGKKLDDALSSAYSLYMPDLNAFEQKWREYLKSKR